MATDPGTRERDGSRSREPPEHSSVRESPRERGCAACPSGFPCRTLFQKARQPCKNATARRGWLLRAASPSCPGTPCVVPSYSAASGGRRQLRIVHVT